jgi:hypothetical protein
MRSMKRIRHSGTRQVRSSCNLCKVELLSTSKMLKVKMEAVKSIWKMTRRL